MRGQRWVACNTPSTAVLLSLAFSAWPSAGSVQSVREATAMFGLKRVLHIAGAGWSDAHFV